MLYGSLSLSLSRRNIPVETQDLAENQDQDHSDEDSRLLHESPDAHVADNTDAVACCKTCHSHRKAATEMHETTMVGVSNVTCCGSSSDLFYGNITNKGWAEKGCRT